MRSLEQIMQGISPERRNRVEAHAAELIAEELTRRELRRARKVTRTRVGKTLGVSEGAVLRLEKRADLMLSAFRKSVEAMGGKVSLVVEFPDRPPAVLSGIGEGEPRARSPVCGR